MRGQLRSYGKVLKVDIDPYLQQASLQPVRPAVLVSHSHTPRYRRVVESIARRAVYVVITAAIAIPVWGATRTHVNGNPAGTTASLDQLPTTATSQGRSQYAERTVPSAEPSAYVASLNPITRSSVLRGR